MKRKLSIMFIILFSFTTVAQGQITWYSLKEGRERAMKERKPMFVDFFYGKGCPRCEQMDKELYENPEIAKKIMAYFIPIRIDLTGTLTEDEETLGNLYDFKHDCLLFILDPEGKLINTKCGIRLCFVDTLKAGDFLRYLEEIK